MLDHKHHRDWKEHRVQSGQPASQGYQGQRDKRGHRVQPASQDHQERWVYKDQRDQKASEDHEGLGDQGGLQEQRGRRVPQGYKDFKVTQGYRGLVAMGLPVLLWRHTIQ